jgi:hypothetical protein
MTWPEALFYITCVCCGSMIVLGILDVVVALLKKGAK